MSKGIIIYQSKYGATKKYVDWLIEETGYDCIETKSAKVSHMKNYDKSAIGRTKLHYSQESGHVF